ncbi:uncharacterized protein [Panulirus ornatus]
MAVTCMVFILGSIWEPIIAIELEDAKTTWISFLLTDQDIKANKIKNTKNSQKMFQDTNIHEMITDVPAYQDQKLGRLKRVFLSRGWGPGGYEAPPPPQRFVRRPPVRQSPQIKTKERSFPKATGSSGGARYAALVSSRQKEQKALQKPQYRRFHSIFTSGTWSPLGKRSNDINIQNSFKDSLEKYVGYKETSQSRFYFDDGKLSNNENKRSGVFASYGWGAGGSSPPSKHPWMQPSASSLRLPIYPRVISLTDSSSSGDRHTESFRSGGILQGKKPLFHLFVSHGWGPMGR